MSMTVRVALSRGVRIPCAWAVASLGLMSVMSAHASDPKAGPDTDERALVVRIGHAAPVSGPIAALGKDEENGVRMALDELNARKLQLGGRPVQWKLEAGDDVGDPGQAVALATRFCDKKVAAVVGHLQSGTTLPAARVYHDCDIPNITPAATNPAITEAGYGETFRVIANDKAMVNALLDYAVKYQGVKRLAIIDDRTAYGQGIVKLIETAAAERDVQIVDKQYTSDKATQFAPILTAIKGHKPDAIFFGGLDAQAGPMLRQMSQLAMDDVKFLGGDAQCSERLPVMADKAAALKNVICVMSGSSLGNMPGGLAWKKKYDQRFAGQYQVYSPYAYDATMVLARAMLSADSALPEAYVPRLRQTHHDGVTGTIAFDAQGELQNPRVTLYGYSSGERKELAISEP